MSQKNSPEPEIIETASPWLTSPAPGTYPLINMLVWAAQMPPLTKLVIRYLVDIAKDGAVNIPLQELLITTGLSKKQAAEELTRLVELGIVFPPRDEPDQSEHAVDYDWELADRVDCKIFPSGLLRLYPDLPSPPVQA